jgi:hypothetical protein
MLPYLDPWMNCFLVVVERRPPISSFEQLEQQQNLETTLDQNL